MPTSEAQGAVVSGMLAATLLGVFLVPPLFVMVERLVTKRGPTKAPMGSPGDGSGLQVAGEPLGREPG
jgi:hypothetical protein